jgi:hypothetical protein
MVSTCDAQKGSNSHIDKVTMCPFYIISYKLQIGYYR